MKRVDYFLLPWYQKIGITLVESIKGLGLGIAHFIVNIPKLLASFFKMIGGAFASLGHMFADGGIFTKLSFIIMGIGNIFKGQIIKGLIFLAVEAGFIFYMIVFGWQSLLKLDHLGTQARGWVFDEELGIEVMAEGDNSMLILLYGIVTIFVCIAFIFFWVANIKSSYKCYQTVKAGKKPLKFIEDCAQLLDRQFHKTLLFLPITGVLLFTITPLVYMICIAFTNYDKDHQVPGNLFTWVGFDNFKAMMGSGSVLGKSFWPILGWTLVWAVFATFLNYIFGIILAMLINKKGIRCKGLFRTLFVLAIAVPQFVSLLVMRNVLAEQGPLNILLQELHLIETPLPFLTDPTWARVMVILVNLWIGIPYTMLITSGILLNIPDDLYEAATIDGASPYVMFTKITMPYVVFVTTPYLITQFIGNINNFSVIYFLTGGNPATLDYYQAGKTDLLITWLYKLTVNQRDYSFASTIGILVFIICAIVSLITFRKSGSYKNEEAFQ